jgi:hypothetical protein
MCTISATFFRACGVVVPLPTVAESSSLIDAVHHHGRAAPVEYVQTMPTKVPATITEFAVQMLDRLAAIPNDAKPQLLDAVEEQLQTVFGDVMLPLPGQTVAVSITTPKTAALLFDRVWTLPFERLKPPSAISVYGGTDFEM